MHVAVIFGNIGPYHAARLGSASALFGQKGWRMTAVRALDETPQHPFGKEQCERAAFAGRGRAPFHVTTLLPDPPEEVRAEPARWDAASSQVLGAHLDELRPDAVAVPGWGFAYARAALNWCKRRGAAAILMSESKWDDDRRRWWKEALKSWLYVRRFDAALVGGRMHEDYLVRLGFPRERIFTGYDAVDNDFFGARADAARADERAARARSPRIPARPYFVCATRLVARKNVHRLVAAYAAYRREVGAEAAWDLAVCGSGEDEPAVREAARSGGVEGHLHLPGFVSYQEMGDWYGLAGAFVHPAVQEQWGLVVNEACAAGLPILCSRTVGAAHELVREGENGLLFDPHDEEEMARRMCEVTRLGEERRRAMGESSRQIVGEFGPHRFAQGLSRAVEAASLG